MEAVRKVEYVSVHTEYDAAEQAVAELNRLGEAGFVIPEVAIMDLSDDRGPKCKIVPASMPVEDARKWYGDLIAHRLVPCDES